MNLSEMPEGWTAYTQLACRVLMVVKRRVDGFACYVDAVPGHRHDDEWQAVLAEGDKLDEGSARAICLHRFHPGLETDDLPYAL